MRRADIEVPNLPVDVNSWGRSACYPRGSFYPLSDGPPTRNHRITKPDFRPCSTCMCRSQAPFCLCTLRAISDRAEGTFGRLRYFLGGDRPSQTAHLTMSRDQIHGLRLDRKSTRLNSSHANISYAVFCLKKKNMISKLWVYELAAPRVTLTALILGTPPCQQTGKYT